MASGGTQSTSPEVEAASGPPQRARDLFNQWQGDKHAGCPVGGCKAGLTNEYNAQQHFARHAREEIEEEHKRLADNSPEKPPAKTPRMEGSRRRQVEDEDLEAGAAGRTAEGRTAELRGQTRAWAGPLFRAFAARGGGSALTQLPRGVGPGARGRSLFRSLLP